jgi:AraC family transcriptional regulator
MRQTVFPTGARFSEDNLVLNARARRHVVQDFAGPLSIKTVMDGAVSWIVDGRHLVVDSGTFLVLNDRQQYSMNLDATHSIETCVAFFQKGFVERIAQDATSSVQASLDEPQRDASPLQFLSRLHADPEGRILPHLWSLAKRCSTELQPSSFEEDFLVLSERLVLLYREVAAQLSKVPGMRTSTREELFRRLQVAREYLHGSSETAVSLNAVAREACLSRYHLHRAFTKVFGQTPHAYLTTLRLEKAHSLLRRGNSVTEVCMTVGFSSVSSFGRLYRKQFGCTPSSTKLSDSGTR